MKLPVNPDVVRVCVKFYSLLKRVKEEARKLLDKIKSEAYEYVQNSKALTKFPLLKGWLLPLLKTPQSQVRDEGWWSWQYSVKLSGTELANLFEGLSIPAPKRETIFYTPSGTPVVFGTIAPSSELDLQGKDATWL